MQERYLGKLEPNMPVCDRDGEKVGSIARVYRYEMATVGEPTASVPPYEEIIEVKTGLFGLGHHYYIPLSAIEDVTEGGVILSVSQGEMDQRGWGEKPTYLEELR